MTKVIIADLDPIEDLQQSVQKSLRDSGYDSKNKILELIQEVKKEIADERENLKQL